MSKHACFSRLLVIPVFRREPKDGFVGVVCQDMRLVIPSLGFLMCLWCIWHICGHSLAHTSSFHHRPRGRWTSCKKLLGSSQHSPVRCTVAPQKWSIVRSLRIFPQFLVKTKTDDLIWKEKKAYDLPGTYLLKKPGPIENQLKNIGVVKEDLIFRRKNHVFSKIGTLRWKSWVCLRLHPTAREVYGEVRIGGNIDVFGCFLKWWYPKMDGL